MLGTQNGASALLQDKLGDDLKEYVDIAPYTTFDIGGPARYFYEAKTSRHLVYAYDLAVRSGLGYIILGGGSNMLFADEGFKGIVIRDACNEIKVKGERISTHSGVRLDNVVDIARANSLTGLEFAAGIPGNVGGAIYGNAGAFGSAIDRILDKAVIYFPGSGVRIVNADYFDFNYRHSKLKKDFELILSATFKLRSGKNKDIADKIKEYRELRRTKHPDFSHDGCAGSVFKNIKKPELLPAGKLLEDAGVRGMKVGGAEVYHKHCNIIINNGKATAADVIKLSSIMRQKVIDKFDIELEYEMLVINP